MTSANIPHRGFRDRWWGWLSLASLIMLVAGLAQLIHGIVALAHTQMMLVTQGGSSLALGFSHVGWTYLVVGIFLVAAGIGVLFGWTWARVVGIGLAAVSLLVNLAFFTVYPIWSTVAIVLDVIVIYALAAHGAVARPAPR
jgi:hypothetical protein